MKYKVGDKVRIKSIDWYNENKDKDGIVELSTHIFVPEMLGVCGAVVTIKDVFKDTNGNVMYYMKEIDWCWSDEMIEGLVEDEMKSEDELLDKYEELTDRAFKGGYEKCQSDILLNGYELPEGYIFKDQAGNEIHALKIVLEKANTLKTQSDNTLKIQSDNMETETHRGYYTTEEETTNKSKKVAWFTFWDNDFADKVELDLTNRELIKEEGKWFVVKKKKEYPKTYEECAILLDRAAVRNNLGYKGELLVAFQKLLVCRDAYWQIAGEEMGLGKPWEPDWGDGCYVIITIKDKIQCGGSLVKNYLLAFPTEEMRDAFYENFKKEIEMCKELL